MISLLAGEQHQRNLAFDHLQKSADTVLANLDEQRVHPLLRPILPVLRGLNEQAFPAEVDANGIAHIPENRIASNGVAIIPLLNRDEQITIDSSLLRPKLAIGSRYTVACRPTIVAYSNPTMPVPVVGGSLAHELVHAHQHNHDTTPSERQIAHDAKRHVKDLPYASLRTEKAQIIIQNVLRVQAARDELEAYHVGYAALTNEEFVQYADYGGVQPTQTAEALRREHTTPEFPFTASIELANEMFERGFLDNDIV